MPRSANVCPRNRVRYTAEEAGLSVSAASGGEITGTTINSGATGTIVFGTSSDEIVLDVVPTVENSATAPQRDDNWTNGSFSMKLTSSLVTILPNPGGFEVTVIDDEDQPVAEFTRANVLLTENSSTIVNVRVGAFGRTQVNPATALAGLDDNLVIVVDPPTAFDTPEAVAAARKGVASLDGAAPVVGSPGQWTLDVDVMTLAAEGKTGAGELTIMAYADMSGFKDPQITISFEPKGLKALDIAAGSALVVNIDSDEAIPTLSFSPTDVTIDEGGSTETVLIAEGAHGSEVGMVKLSVEGDAMVGLYQGMDKLEEMDGHVYVDLGDSNSARLTARSYSDRDLMDGDMAFKAWKLVEGATDGANVGDGYWFRVDVVGNTAVPALPLIGQLLLALFLMAGGARLYRRRQG